MAGGGGQGALQSMSDRRRGEEGGNGEHQERHHHSNSWDGLAVRPHPQGCTFEANWKGFPRNDALTSVTDALFLSAGDGELVSAPAGPGGLAPCKQPESVWKCQTVRAGPALHWLCPESTHRRSSPGVPLIWLGGHTEYRVRLWCSSAVLFGIFMYVGGILMLLARSRW